VREACERRERGEREREILKRDETEGEGERGAREERER
jgi:hypothetical protein